MHVPEKTILTAGPSISQKEVDYVTDAVKYGWNFKAGEYNDRFERALASYVGTKHAVATSCGTGALHLSLKALGIGKGDEVIVPDMAFIAASNAVEFTGAKPVFADIDERTWCLDPDSFRKRITEKTKAVIPVWMYAAVPDMGRIMEVAQEKGILVVEDSCPALGATFNGKKAGSIGDAGTFSFQGAKTIVIGQGGAVTTNREDVAKKASYYNTFARDPSREFWHTDVGFKYQMSGIQAALGLAQLERAEELLAKKRQVFQWYNKRLSGVECLRLNAEQQGATYWMSSIVLGKSCPRTRQELRDFLKQNKIDTRPFFYPISMFPMYKPMEKENPVSYRVGLNGINLPSGVALSEEQVDYVCSKILEGLGVKG